MANNISDDVKDLSLDLLRAVESLKKSAKGTTKKSINEINNLSEELSNARVKLLDNGNIEDAAKKLAEVKLSARAVSAANGYSNIQLELAIKLMDNMLDEMKSINKAAMELAESITGPFEKLFKFLTKSKIINAILPPDFKDKLDEIKKSFINSLTQLSNSGTLTLRNFTTEIGVMINGYVKLFGTFIQALVANPTMLALAVTIGLIYAAVKLFTKMQDAAIKFRKESGLAVENSKEMEKSALNIVNTSGEYGLTLEGVQEAQTSLIKKYSVISNVTKDLVTTSAFLVENWGLSADESAELLVNMKANGEITDKMAMGLTAATIQLAKAGGVAPGAVLQDMANSSETINKYFKGNNKLAILQTVQLHRMGLELKDVAKITDGLLDFDSSIEKEMYASVLLNKQLDFSNARMLAYQGKTSEAVESMLSQVNNFGSLTVLQKKSVADAIGLSEDQITKSLKLLSVQRQMTSEQKKEYKMLQDKLLKTEEITVESLLSDGNRQLEMQAFSKSWDKLLSNIASILYPIFEALSPALTLVGKIFSIIGDGINYMNNWFASMGKAGGIVGALIGGLIGFGILKVIVMGISALFKNLFGGIVDTVSKAAGAIAKGIGNAIKGLAESVAKIDAMSMIKGALALVIFAGALWLIGQALQQFAGISWEQLAKAGTAIVGLVLTMMVLGAIMNGAWELILAGALALVIMGGALYLVGIGIQAVSEGMSSGGFIENIIAIALISPLLFLAAGGILALSYALLAFTGSSLLNGIVKFFSGNPFKDLIDFAAVAPQLVQASTSLNIMKDVLKNLNDVDTSNFSKIADGLKSITSSLPENSSFDIDGKLNRVISYITGTSGTDIKGSNNNNTSNGTNNNTSSNDTNSNNITILQKLDSIISILGNGFGVYLDGKKVGEQLNKAKTNGNVC